MFQRMSGRTINLVTCTGFSQEVCCCITRNVSYFSHLSHLEIIEQTSLIEIVCANHVFSSYLLQLQSNNLFRFQKGSDQPNNSNLGSRYQLNQLLTN